jgi:hypothetical protein
MSLESSNSRTLAAKGVIFAISTVAIITLGFYLFNEKEHDSVVLKPVVSDDRPGNTIQNSIPAPVAGRVNPPLTAPEFEKHTTRQSLSIKDEVMEIYASRDARSALRAFEMIQKCIDTQDSYSAANELPRGPASDEHRLQIRARLSKSLENCSSIDGMVMQTRRSLLDLAVQGRVPGYSLAALAFGPTGNPVDQYSRSEDPMVEEWHRNVRKMLLEEARNGSIEAAAAGAGRYAIGSLYAFLRLWLNAERDAASKSDENRTRSNRKISMLEGKIKMLEKSLSPSEISAGDIYVAGTLKP